MVIDKIFDIPNSCVGMSNSSSEQLVLGISGTSIVTTKYANPNNSWTDMSFIEETYNVGMPIEYLSCEDSCNDRQVLFITNESGIYVSFTPNEASLYSPSSLYRLYWATDTRKLFMNIMDTWQMIGTTKHELLEDVGTLTHEQLERALSDVLARVGNLEAVPPGSSEINFVEKEW